LLSPALRDAAMVRLAYSSDKLDGFGEQRVDLIVASR
jgi:hypothetical protein